MQTTGRLLLTRSIWGRFAQRFTSLLALKSPLLGNQVSQNFHFQALGTDISAKIQNKLVKALGNSCLPRSFSSELSQNIVRHSRAEEEEFKLVGRVINQRQWCDETENQLGSLNLELSVHTALLVLQNLEENPETALKFFMWAGKQTDFEHSANTYNAVIRVLGNNKYIDQFWSMMQEMKNEGYEMDLKTYITVLRRFLKRKMMEDAVSLFIFMMDNSEHKPSSQNCSTVLHQLSLFSSPDLNLVFRVVEAFQNGGGRLDKAIYDGIHRSLCSAGKFKEAEKIVKDMEEAGFIPDNITYSQLVFGLCKAERLGEACKILDEMKGLGCIPDLKTWTILMEGHCRVGEIDGALVCFKEMLENGCGADGEVLAVLVNGFCNQNRVEDAHNFLCQMIELKNLKPWQATFKSLLEKLTRAGKLPEALRLLDLMRSQGFPPFADPFIEVFPKTGTVDGALDFLKRLTKKRAPSVKTYFALLEAFCKAGKQVEAQDLLYKCPHHIRQNHEVLSLFGSMNAASPA